MDWISLGEIAIALLIGIFGGGVVWGSLRGTLQGHHERISVAEDDIKEIQREVIPALGRLEGKMDIIVTTVMTKEKR